MNGKKLNISLIGRIEPVGVCRLNGLFGRLRGNLRHSDFGRGEARIISLHHSVDIVCNVNRNAESSRRLVFHKERVAQREVEHIYDFLRAFNKLYRLLRTERAHGEIVDRVHARAEFGSRFDELRKDALRALSRETETTVVLKSSVVWITSGDAVYIYDGANPSMGIAGSGDVLSGIIAALLAEGESPERAAIDGVILHQEAGRNAARRYGYYDAETLIEEVGRAR